MVISDPIPPNPIDSLAYKIYQSLGFLRWFGRTPINPDLGINCGGQKIDRFGRYVDWDGFCLEQWNKGWAIFANLLIWLIVTVVVIMVLRRKFFPKQKKKRK